MYNTINPVRTYTWIMFKFSAFHCHQTKQVTYTGVCLNNTVMLQLLQDVLQGLAETQKLHECLLVTSSSWEFTGPSPGLLTSIQYLRHSNTDARVNTDSDITLTGQEHLLKVSHSSLIYATFMAFSLSLLLVTK